MAHALSRKASAKLNTVVVSKWKLLEEFSQINLVVEVKGPQVLMASLHMEPTLVEKLKWLKK